MQSHQRVSTICTSDPLGMSQIAARRLLCGRSCNSKVHTPPVPVRARQHAHIGPFRLEAVTEQPPHCAPAGTIPGSSLGTAVTAGRSGIEFPSVNGRPGRQARADFSPSVRCPNWRVKMSPSANSHRAPRHQKQPDGRQHRLKFPPRSTTAWIVATEFLDELDIAVHEAQSALDMGFGGEPFTPLARNLESKVDRRNRVRVPFSPPVQ